MHVNICYANLFATTLLILHLSIFTLLRKFIQLNIKLNVYIGKVSINLCLWGMVNVWLCIKNCPRRLHFLPQRCTAPLHGVWWIVLSLWVSIQCFWRICDINNWCHSHRPSATHLETGLEQLTHYSSVPFLYLRMLSQRNLFIDSILAETLIFFPPKKLRYIKVHIWFDSDLNILRNKLNASQNTCLIKTAYNTYRSLETVIM